MGTWINRDETQLQEAYDKLVVTLMSRNSLAAPPVSHYSGSFGFHSMVAEIASNGGEVENLVSMKGEVASIRAHEAFHGFQAFAFQSVRELFRELQRISRRQLLTLAQITKDGIKIKPGESIFYAGLRCKATAFQNPHKALDASISTIEKSVETVEGVSVFDLVEGSAAAVQVLNEAHNYHALDHFNVASQMDELQGIYSNAWKLYRRRGGQSIAVFALLAASSLRFGSVSPANFDNLPSPQEVFEYLSRFAKRFDSWMNNAETETPDFFSEKPLGTFPDSDFTPLKAELPFSEWGDYPPSTSAEHHFPDEMFEPVTADALESYNGARTPEQLRLQDNLFGVSMEISKAMNAAYIRVGPPVSTEELGKEQLIYDRLAKSVFDKLPGLTIEEVLLRAIAQPDFHARMADLFENEAKTIRFTPWDNASIQFDHTELVTLFDLAQKIELVSLAEAADVAGEREAWANLMPACCAKHSSEKRTLKQFVSCENDDSAGKKFGEFFGVSLASIWEKRK